MSKEEFLQRVSSEKLRVLPTSLSTAARTKRYVDFWRKISETNTNMLQTKERGLRVRYGNMDTDGNFKAKSGGFLQFVGDVEDAECTGGKKPTFLWLEGEYADRGGRKPKWSVQLSSTVTLAIEEPDASVLPTPRKSPERQRTPPAQRARSPSTRRVRAAA
jgi:hypothetical protein